MNPHRPRLTLMNLAVHVALSGAIGGATASSAHAADEAPDTLLATVTVNGRADADPYGVKRSATATKTDSLIRDIPQSITVITRELIDDQAMQSMADVSRYVPGVGMANGEGNRDAPIFRGSANASGDFYIDGVRDDVEYYRDLYNVERVEALTGPNAMIFGRGGSGGIINRVPKQADWSTVRSADLTVGTFRTRRLSADFAQPLDQALAVRVTAMVEHSDGYQRNAHLERSGINPSVALRAGRDTVVTVGVEHVEDKRTADRGVPSLAGKPLDLPVSAFFGDPDPATRPIRLSANAVSGLIDHDLGHGARLQNKTRYTDYDKLYQNYNPGAYTPANGLVAMSAYNNHQWRKNLFNQTDLTLALAGGGIEHTLLLGMELGRQSTDYLRKTGVFSNGQTSIPVRLAAPDLALPVAYVLGASSADRDGSSEANIAGIYAQDQMTLTQRWQLIAGVRVDSFKLDYDNHQAQGAGKLAPSAAHLASHDTLVSPRIGLVYKPAPSASLYANYSVAAFPRGGDQLSSLSVVNQCLKPEKFINLEAGAKLELRPELLATLAIYHLQRNNVAVINPATGVADQLVDGQLSKGIELGVEGKLCKSWSIKAGYARQSATLLATASATALSGATIGMVPKHALSMWNRYDFTPAFGAGLGLLYRDDMFASTSNAVTLPGYARIDGALFYTASAQLKLQLNVENLLDRKYYASANGDNNITPGSPRALKLSVHGNF